MLALLYYLKLYTTSMVVICREGRLSFEMDAATIIITLYKMKGKTIAAKARKASKSGSSPQDCYHRVWEDKSCRARAANHAWRSLGHQIPTMRVAMVLILIKRYSQWNERRTTKIRAVGPKHVLLYESPSEV